MNKDFGKFLCYLLRHKPSAAHLNMDEHGWVDIQELIDKVNQYSTYEINYDILMETVREDSKQRYEIVNNMIRAAYGHSVRIDPQYRERVPPITLFHGTSSENEEQIKKEGILPQTRLYVHLSPKIEVAASVGARHRGNVVVYVVDAQKMFAAGYSFYKVGNTWLTDKVPSKYIKKVGRGE